MSRSARLTAYNPYDLLPETEHDLVRLFLVGEATHVNVDDKDWLQKTSESLIQDSEVILVGDPKDPPTLRKALMDVMTVPIDTGFMLLHPKVDRVDRRVETIEIGLSLPEGVQ